MLDADLHFPMGGMKHFVPGNCNGSRIFHVSLQYMLYSFLAFTSLAYTVSSVGLLRLFTEFVKWRAIKCKYLLLKLAPPICSPKK